ncbi:hypothetical protein FB45DRAFT_729613, partial [Roridomyces roridus]
VHAVRALIDFRYLGQVPEIDEETITRTDASLAEFHGFKHHIISAGGREQPHFFIPKLELMHSVVPSMRWAGAPIQYTADVTEKAHSTEIKVPARTETNHRDYDPQIVRYLDRAEKLRLFDLSTGILASSIALELDGPDAEPEDEGMATVSPSDVPSSTGESARTIRNLFAVAKLHAEKWPLLERRVFTSSSIAFSLNRSPSLRISVDEAAKIFQLPDLRSALGDYLDQCVYAHRDPNTSPIGGRRKSRPDHPLPFTQIEIWFAVRVQVMSPHRATPRPLQAQTLQAQPPDPQGEWTHGRCDTVLLANNREASWPGEGFRSGLTVAQIRLILRPVWGNFARYLIYAQRYDIVPQPGSPTGREQSTGMYILKRALRADRSRMADITEVENIRIPAQLIPRVGPKPADARFSPFTALESCKEVRLNKYSSKELFWIM